MIYRMLCFCIIIVNVIFIFKTIESCVECGVLDGEIWLTVANMEKNAVELNVYLEKEEGKP